MCGIAGSCNFRGDKINREILERMVQTLEHRGPDDKGIYISGDMHPNAKAQIGFGHRRLSIIDLETGHQPISNEDGTIRIVYNGEIYNYIELKERLLKKGHEFRTKSDTEVIVHLYEDKGLDCVEDLRGMFAFAIWDSKIERLFLARDRVGKKPLVYHFDGRNFTFASEIRTLLQRGIKKDIDFNSIDYFLTYGYVPSPGSILQGIRKLPPAHILTFDKNGIKTKRYWRLNYRKNSLSFEESKECLRGLLAESVKLRLISDVPLGAFLSGGIDSSSIVAFMSAVSNAPVKTFTIGFEEADYNEIAFARRVAKNFNTDHHEFIVKPNAVEVLNKIIWHYGEPFGDSSCIPNYYVAKMAAKFVKVALNGDGGDESFAGYDKYIAMRIGKLMRNIPRPLVKTALAMLVANRALFGKIAHRMMKKLDIKTTPRYIDRYIENFLRVLLKYPNEWDRYISWVSIFKEEMRGHLYEANFKNRLNNTSHAYILDILKTTRADNEIEKAMEVDIYSYLPEDLLVKMDIATMSHSIEARSPLLDHKLMEFAASLPIDFKLKLFKTKFILKDLMKYKLSDEILERDKMGFCIPIGRWFRNDLRQFTYETLLDKKCLDRGYFKKESIKSLLDEHSSGRRDHELRIWCLLNLELWHRMFIDSPVPQDVEADKITVT